MRRPRLLPLLVVVALAATAWRLLRARDGAVEAAPDAALHVVDRGPVALTLKESGVVRPRQTVAVKSKVSGRVRELRVGEGDAVRAGDLVAVIEPDAEAALTLAQKRMEVHRQALDLAQKEREWRRQDRLRREGLVPERAAEEAERDWRTAEALFQESRTALHLLEREANQPETRSFARPAQAGAALTEHRILAPMDGVVSTVKARAGELLTSGTSGLDREGALLLEVADLSELEVWVDVNELDVARVRPGMPARVTLAAGAGGTAAARVTRVAVAPRASENKVVVYPVVLRLEEKPAGIRQGMTASVDLTLESVEDAVRVPLLSWGERDGKTWVRKAGPGGELADAEVALGLRGDRHVAVVSGLAAGDRVAARWPREGGEGAKSP